MRDKILSSDHCVTDKVGRNRTPYLHFSVQHERGEQHISVFRFSKQGTDAGRLYYFYGLLLKNKGKWLGMWWWMISELSIE